MSFRILLVDDNPKILSFIKPALEEHGYHVMLACDGEQALRLWEIEQPDLLVLDIEIPEPNGLAVCRKIREYGDSVPIIFLTVRNSISDLELGFGLGASDYISKPFDIRELIARVKARLPQPVQEFSGELRVDLQRHNVSICRQGNWQVLNLTPKEFELINFLVAHAGRPIGRSVLLESIFEIPENSNLQTKTLEKHIWSLRQKLEVDPKNPRWLQNVRGIGYKFEPKHE